MKPLTKADDITPSIAGDPAKTGSVVLRGVTVALDADVGHSFIVDCARHTEGVLTAEEIKNKWALRSEHWQKLADNAPLLQAVRAERDRRILGGEAAREAAQRHFAKAPNVLGDILTDQQVAPRHRIEAARELRQAASSGEVPVGPRETFKIIINLGGDDRIVCETGVAPCEPLPPDDGEQS